MKKRFFYLMTTFLFFSGLTSSNSQTRDCSDHPKDSIKENNLEIRKKVYSTIKDIQNSKLSDKDKNEWKSKYGILQKEFNDIYMEMKDDRMYFATWKKLCERYGNRLDAAEGKANDYYTDARNAIKKPVAGMGISTDDIIAVLKLAWGLHKNNVNNLYKDLKWDDWNIIVGGK